jgi:nicotinic acid mononucleotide adenylyltransferase
VAHLQSVSSPALDWVRRISSSSKVAVLDSSFNPPTKAHVQMIQQAVKYLQEQDTATGMLLQSVKNADKLVQVGARFDQRVEMVAKIREIGDLGIAIINRALFVEKAEILLQELGQVKLFFIVGEDTMVRILDPKYYPKEGMKEALHELFSKAELICFRRSASSDQEKELEARIEASGYRDKIHRIALLDPSLELISSTQARECFASGNSSALSRILPSEIIEYCTSEGLYHH